MQQTVRNISALYQKILKTLNFSRLVLLAMVLLFLFFFLLINGLHLNGLISVWSSYFLGRIYRMETAMDEGRLRDGDLPAAEHELRISTSGVLLQSPDPALSGLRLQESGFFGKVSRLEIGQISIIFYPDLIDGLQRVHFIKRYQSYYQIRSYRQADFFPSTLASGTRLAVVSDGIIWYTDNPLWLGNVHRPGLLRFEDLKLYLIAAQPIPALSGGQLVVFQDISSDMLLIGGVTLLLLLVIIAVNWRTGRIQTDFELLRQEHDSLLDFTEKLSASIGTSGSDPALMLDTMIPALAQVLQDASGKPFQFDENIHYHALIRSFALELLHLIGLLRDEKENLAKYQAGLEDSIMERTAELTQARDAARSANRAKSNFLANMSHELRTPLNAILGFTQLMSRDEALPASHRGRLEVINRSGEHLLALINDILEISKIEAGRIELHLQTVPLDDFLQGIMDMYSHRAGQKGLDLQLELEAGLPERICTDAAKLNQILVNLLGNAIKFTQTGTVSLSIGLQPADRNALHVSVRDTGVGIAPADVERIFQPFEQVFSSSMGQGTGLGLAITREYVALLGGELTLQSQPGSGSEFSFVLPLPEVPNGKAAGLAPRPHRRVLRLSPGQREFRVLIAEDNEANRQLLSDLLRSVGFVVKTAENGRLALELFKNWKPDFAWLDMHMPEMNGLETIKAIRRHELLVNPVGQWYRVPVAVITADSLSDTRNSMLESGSDGILTKPFKNEEVLRMMAGLLSARFDYADETAAVSAWSNYGAEATCLTPENLALLPPELAGRLYQSIVMLDDQLISELTGEIRGIHDALAAELAKRCGQFEYDPIIKWLENGSEA